MKTSIKDLGLDKWQLLLGCALYIVVLILWILELVDNKTAFLGGISALLTILSSYEFRHKTIEED